MAEIILNERFRGPSLDPRLRWLNPPPSCTMDSSGLVVRSAEHTDFWQQTHYGFRGDNGHFLHLDVAGDFAVTTKLSFQPTHQYDQAGLMVRVGPSCWIKTSVEHEPEGPKLGVVVTNHNYSDWSLQNFTGERIELQLRIRRQSQDFLVEWSPVRSANWELLRMTHLHEGGGQPLLCGLYACSPKGGGFGAEFEFLQLETLPCPDGTSHLPT
jgi:uncharacterized protein